MAKPLTRTTVMDEGEIDARPKVRIDRHPLDWNTLAETVAGRIEAALRQDPTGCRYFNPTVTVSCPSPSPEFFGVVRKEQARWCQQAGHTFRRNVRRRVSTWVSDEPLVNKHARYLDRAVCFTGILFINGQVVPHHHWPESATKQRASSRTSSMSRSNSTSTSILESQP